MFISESEERFLNVKFLQARQRVATEGKDVLKDEGSSSLVPSRMAVPPAEDFRLVQDRLPQNCTWPQGRFQTHDVG